MDMYGLLVGYSTDRALFNSKKLNSAKILQRGARESEAKMFAIILSARFEYEFRETTQTQPSIK